jgi:4-amino-4-deoxychorismate lyase
MMLVNGAPADSIPVTDRGLAYGDGVFRTFAAVQGEPLHWARQYGKLESDCARLGIVCPAAGVLLDDARRAAAGCARAAVKIIVTRGSGPRGYAPPPTAAPLRVVMADAYTSAPRAQGVSLHRCRLRLAHQPALAGVKHLNRLENVLARAEWSDSAVAEGLLLDQDGHVIGGTMSNLFIVERGALTTPDLSRCGVAGVTRERVSDLAHNAGVACRVEHLPLQRVLDADEVFLTNSLIGVWPVARMGEHRWPVGPLARQAAQWLKTDDGDDAADS